MATMEDSQKTTNESQEASKEPTNESSQEEPKDKQKQKRGRPPKKKAKSAESTEQTTTVVTNAAPAPQQMQYPPMMTMNQPHQQVQMMNHAAQWMQQQQQQQAAMLASTAMMRNNINSDNRMNQQQQQQPMSELQKAQQELAKERERNKKLEAALAEEKEKAQKTKASLLKVRQDNKKRVAAFKERLEKEKKQHEATRLRLKQFTDSFGGRNLAVVAPPAPSAKNSSGATAEVQQEETTLIKMNKHDKKWQDQYEQLQKFKAKYGHCNVATSKDSQNFAKQEEEFPRLSNWVRVQRMNWTSLKQGKKSQLTPYRLQLLNQVGLDFRPTGRDAVKFETRLKQLEDYRSEHGHCNVPQFYKPVSGLGEWVLYIRRKYYDQQLPAERVTALENLGFQWRLRAPRGSKQYEQQAATGPSNDHDTHHLW